MYIHGEFVNIKGETVAVHIVTGGDRSTEKVIGEKASGLYFAAEDAVEIESEVNDTFDHLLRRSATIRLLSRDFVSDFFQASCRDAVVNVYRSGKCEFAGFIEPQSYSQAYNEVLDEVDLSCIDALSALQYSKYKNVGMGGSDFATALAGASNRTFKAIVEEVLNGVSADLDILGTGTVEYLHDASKAVSSSDGSKGTVFGDIEVSDNLFLGDEEDDVWQQDEVLEEVLRYLNLHIVQEGLTFYIFDWATIKATSSITWYALDGTEQDITARQTVSITNSNAADCDTQISVGEVFNQLLLTCEMDDVENIIESPLDEDYLEPVFNHYIKYCTEYSSEGFGETSTKAMYYMLRGEESLTTYEKAVIYDWFLRVKDNPLWRFPYGDSNDMISHFYPNGSDGGYQEAAPNYMNSTSKPISALLVSIGGTSRNMAKKDNAPTSSLDLTDYLVVSVNGNGDLTENGSYPQPSDLLAACPVAEYTGGSSVNLTPSKDYTNYIVISGKIILSALQSYINYNEVKNCSLDTLKNTFAFGGGSVKSKNNEDGRYYSRAFYKNGTDTGASPTVNSTTDELGIAPFNSDEAVQEYEFNYSAVGDSTDTLSKVPVLQCMLIIGDKCAVEDMEMDGAIGTITWQTYKTLEECADEDEYYQQSFSIGFNPAIGDKILNAEFDIQNNIDYSMNIDAEGTAIRITVSDGIKGKVQFKILGPVNTMWDDITRRHRTWFRRTKWTTNAVPLLAATENIFLKDFEIKVYSDNGRINSESDDNDVIYMSDTDESYINKKDDLTFKICTQLTSAECAEMGVSTGVKKCTPLNVNTGNGLTTLYDRNAGESAKAEQLYVDAYYTEYHTPHVIMEQSLDDKGGTVSGFNHYIHPAMGKEFFVQGVSRNLANGEARVVMKEL